MTSAADPEVSYVARVLVLFGTPANTTLWFSTPISALDNRRPFDLISSREGRETLEELLHRLENSVLC